jgi:arylformamidase
MAIREGEKGTVSETKILVEMTREWSAPHFKKPCVGYESRTLILPEHSATHVDSPYHFVPNKDTIDKVPLEHFIGKAVLLDLRRTQKAGAPVQKRDLIAVCSRDNINIEKGDIAIIFSETGFKGLADDAVDWLVSRGIKAVGTNVFIEEDRMENGLRVRYAHMTFLSRGINIFEGLVNLDEIPSKRFVFVGLPLKIERGTGSPIRAIAIV